METCVFCGEEKDAVEFKGEKLCEDCIDEIDKRAKEQLHVC